MIPRRPKSVLVRLSCASKVFLTGKRREILAPEKQVGRRARCRTRRRDTQANLLNPVRCRAVGRSGVTAMRGRMRPHPLFKRPPPSAGCTVRSIDDVSICNQRCQHLALESGLGVANSLFHKSPAKALPRSHGAGAKPGAWRIKQGSRPDR